MVERKSGDDGKFEKKDRGGGGSFAEHEKPRNDDSGNFVSRDRPVPPEKPKPAKED